MCSRCRSAEGARPRAWAALAAVAVAVALAGCDRESRAFRGKPLPESTADTLTLTDFYAGTPNPPPPDEAHRNEYERNAYHLSEGKRLYSAYNCVGCHAHGGGSIGPPLMDADWRYGSDLEQIHATIVQGRPNGMPSFRGKIPDQQVWQIAAYVRSMSGNAPPNAAPARDDHMQGSPAENTMDRQAPQPADSPGAAQ